MTAVTREKQLSLQLLRVIACQGLWHTPGQIRTVIMIPSVCLQISAAPSHGGPGGGAGAGAGASAAISAAGRNAAKQKKQVDVKEKVKSQRLKGQTLGR